MNRRVALVLGCTFGALVAATVWVPVEYDFVTFESPQSAGTLPGWCWAWRFGALRPTRIVWLPYLAQIAAPIVFGGLLALFFRTRAARAA